MNEWISLVDVVVFFLFFFFNYFQLIVKKSSGLLWYAPQYDCCVMYLAIFVFVLISFYCYYFFCIFWIDWYWWLMVLLMLVDVAVADSYDQKMMVDFRFSWKNYFFFSFSLCAFTVAVVVYCGFHFCFKLDFLCLLTVSSTQFFFHSLLRCFRQVGSLNIFLYANQRFLQCIEWAWVQHLLLNLFVIGFFFSCGKKRWRKKWWRLEIRNFHGVYCMYQIKWIDFKLTLAVSGHQDIKNSFCFFELSDVPWHWCMYSKSKRPYLETNRENN